jgi:hypothetical protein
VPVLLLICRFCIAECLTSAYPDWVPSHFETKSLLRGVMTKHSILMAMVAMTSAVPMAANAQGGSSPVSKLNFTGGSMAVFPGDRERLFSKARLTTSRLRGSLSAMLACPLSTRRVTSAI